MDRKRSVGVSSNASVSAMGLDESSETDLGDAWLRSITSQDIPSELQLEAPSNFRILGPANLVAADELVAGSLSPTPGSPAFSFDGSSPTDKAMLLQHWDRLWLSVFPRFVRPYEADRREYRRTGRSLIIEVHPLFFSALVDAASGSLAASGIPNTALHATSTRKVLDGFSALGLVPVDTDFMNDRQTEDLSNSGHMSPGVGMRPIRFRYVQYSRVIFEDESTAPIGRIRELEEEIRDLTRQLNKMQERNQLVAGRTSPERPIPAILSLKPAAVPCVGSTAVRIHMSYLDPEGAPYSVCIDRQIVASTVVERRFLVFFAPPHPPGSVPVLVLANGNNGLPRRYCRAVWLDYKGNVQSGPSQRLTYHAVNQLSPEIPLPSSTTAPDPSETKESNTERNDDEDDEKDDTSCVDTESMGTALSDAGHIPLTAELLEMFATKPEGRLALKRIAENLTSEGEDVDVDDDDVVVDQTDDDENREGMNDPKEIGTISVVSTGQVSGKSSVRSDTPPPSLSAMESASISNRRNRPSWRGSPFQGGRQHFDPLDYGNFSVAANASTASIGSGSELTLQRRQAQNQKQKISPCSSPLRNLGSSSERRRRREKEGANSE